MKLSELGPRITMELYKVEKGLAEGDVLYHKFEQKTAAEASALKLKVLYMITFRHFILSSSMVYLATMKFRCNDVAHN